MMARDACERLMLLNGSRTRRVEVGGGAARSTSETTAPAVACSMLVGGRVFGPRWWRRMRLIRVATAVRFNGRRSELMQQNVAAEKERPRRYCVAGIDSSLPIGESKSS